MTYTSIAVAPSIPLLATWKVFSTVAPTRTSPFLSLASSCPKWADTYKGGSCNYGLATFERKQIAHLSELTESVLCWWEPWHNICQVQVPLKIMNNTTNQKALLKITKEIGQCQLASNLQCAKGQAKTPKSKPCASWGNIGTTSTTNASAATLMSPAESQPRRFSVSEICLGILYGSSWREGRLTHTSRMGAVWEWGSHTKFPLENRKVVAQNNPFSGPSC